MKRINKLSFKGGLTLVELVVVMGIIAILTSVILTQVIPAVTKGSDTAIKAEMSAVQTSAFVEYISLGRKFSKTGVAISGVDCATLTTVDTIFENPQIQKALADVKVQNRGIPLSCSISADGSAYAIAATLASTGKYWCIDSTGVQSGAYSGGSVDYIGQSCASVACAVWTGLAPVCN